MNVPSTLDVMPTLYVPTTIPGLRVTDFFALVTRDSPVTGISTMVQVAKILTNVSMETVFV